MAPRFDEYMYNVWREPVGADALVCFPYPTPDAEELNTLRRRFVERLVARLSNTSKWEPRATEGGLGNLEEFCVEFYEPDCTGETARLVISTSREYSCAIEIRSKVHAAEQLASHIADVALELHVTIPRNSHLPSLEGVMMSNKRFTLEGFTESRFARLVRWFGLSR